MNSNNSVHPILDIDDEYVASLLSEEHLSTKRLGLKEYMVHAKPVFHMNLLLIDKMVKVIENTNPHNNSLNYYFYQFANTFEIVNLNPQSFLREIIENIEYTRKEFRYSEHLECMLDVVDEMQLKVVEITRSVESSLFGNQPLALWEILIKKVWERVQSPVFIARCEQRLIRIKKTQVAMEGYVLKLLEKYKRLLVLRLDLEYKLEHAPYISEAEARADLARLLGNRRHNKDLLPDLVGYVVRLEWETYTRFHFHVFFFLDGDLHRRDAHLAQQVGRYWVDVVTQGRGRFENCNLSKHKYDSCGIGMIHLNRPDEVKRLLKDALYYVLTKVKFLVAKELGHRKTLWRGLMPSN